MENAIAIIGMSCRFPEANSSEEYWALLESGVNTASPIPEYRHALVDIAVPKDLRANFLKCRIDEFDAPFFHLTPMEVKFTDPQARLLLECSWEAFEDAGINPDKLRNTPTGVFYGSWIQDYRDMMNLETPPNDSLLRKLIGNVLCSAPGKLSFYYGFTGPNVATNSACSSSIIAVQLACKSLQKGECPIAVAAGTNIILQFQQNGLESVVWNQEKCCTFDAATKGYARAEGVGVLVLKRYVDAIRDKDRIHGVILGFGSCQEGISPSFGAPTVECEATAMKMALEAANISPNMVDYVEAHGTGTQVGDFVETEAILRTYGSNPGEREKPLLVGSGKTNIGHTEATSGIAGIIKVLLSLKHEKIPPHVNLSTLNPKLNFHLIPAKVPTECVPWPRTERTRIAGISSHGYNGTDTHLILQEPPSPNEGDLNLALTEPPFVLAWSAKHPLALEELTELYSSHLMKMSGDEGVADFCYTVAARRAHHKYRRALVAISRQDLIEKLHSKAYVESVADEQKVTPKITLFFPAQAQISRRDILNVYNRFPVFRQYISKCDQTSMKLWNYSLTADIKFAECDRCLDIRVFNFCTLYSLGKLLESCGLKLEVVMGNGVGEIVAQVFTGQMKLETGLKMTLTLEADPLKTSAKCDRQCAKEEIVLEIGSSVKLFQNSELFKFALGDKKLPEEIESTLTALYAMGVDINWKSYYLGRQARIADVPHYPFQRKRYWFDRKPKRNGHLSIDEIHPLLGGIMETAGNVCRFQKLMVLTPDHFANQHVIGERVIMPGTSFLEMILWAGHYAVRNGLGEKSKILSVNEFAIHSPLMLEESSSQLLQTVVTEPVVIRDERNLQINIYTKSNEGGTKWRDQASGQYSFAPSQEDEALFAKIDVSSIQKNSRLIPAEEVRQTYKALANWGFEFRGTMQSVAEMYINDQESLFRINDPNLKDVNAYGLHPVFLDAMLHPILYDYFSDSPSSRKIVVVTAIERFLFRGNARRILFTESLSNLYIYRKNYDSEGVRNVLLVDSVGTVIAVMVNHNMVMTSVDSVLRAATKNQIGDIQETPDMLETFWKACDPQVDLVLTSENIDIEIDEIPEKIKIDRLCGLYALKCWHDLHWEPNEGEEIEVDELAKKLGVISLYTPALRRFLTYLQNSGIVELKSERKFVVLETLPTMADINTEIDELLQELEACSALEMLQACGSQLADVFTGQIEAADVIRGIVNHYGSQSLEDVWCENSLSSLDYKSEVTAAFGSILDRVWRSKWSSKEDRRQLRILQIGADFNEIVADLVSSLENRSMFFQFCVTDTSSDVLENCEARLTKFGKSVTYRTLNIENDPLQQGFAPHHFDIVIHTDIFKNYNKTPEKKFSHLQLLLRSGGFLIIGNSKGHIKEVDIVFGLREDYWQHDYDDNCDTKKTWLKVMEINEFVVSSESKLPDDTLGHLGLTIGQRSTINPTVKLDLFKDGLLERRAWVVFTLGEMEYNFSSLKNRLIELGREIVVYPLDSSSNINEVIGESQETLEGILYVVHEDHLGFQEPNSQRLLEPLLTIAKTLIRYPHSNALPHFHLVTTKSSEIVEKIGSSCYSGPCQAPASTMMWGMMRTFRQEMPNIHSKSIDFDSEVYHDENVENLLSELWTNDHETEVIYQNGRRHVRRLQKHNLEKYSSTYIPYSKERRWKLEAPKSLSIKDVQYVPKGSGGSLQDHQVEVEVRAAGLNFKDIFAIMKPTKDFDGVNPGIDFSGVVTAVGKEAGLKWKAGDAVCSFSLEEGTICSNLVVDGSTLVRIPNWMTFEEAATFPCVFITAWHCLVNVARLQKGQTILVHAASGGVGLMVIEIAKMLGINVIGTAGSPRKRAYLRHIGLEHVVDSRNLAFGENVKYATGGKGVDMVLNCLTAPAFKETSLEVCRDGGHFVEISKMNIWNPSEVQKMRPLVKYHVVDVTFLEKSTSKAIIQQLETLLENRQLTPLPRTTYSALDIVPAFKYLESAKHIGKVVLRMPRYEETSRTYKEVLFNDRSTYLITGGKGAIGIAVAKWMVEQGAKYIILVGRSRPSEDVVKKIAEMETDGGCITCLECDISDYNQCDTIMNSILEKGLPPLRGVHHCSGVLCDKLIANLRWEDFEKVLAPKVKGAFNLHRLTSNLNMEFFVLYSSISSTLGNPGQANYAAANAYLDSLVELRHSMGLNGLVLNWGQWEAGMAKDLEIPLMRPFTIKEGLAALHQSMKCNRRAIIVGNVNWEEVMRLDPLLKNTLLEHLKVGRELSAKNYVGVIAEKIERKSGEGGTQKRATFPQVYAAATDANDRLEAVLSLAIEILCETLGTTKDEIKADDNFAGLGVDSLTAIELMNRVKIYMAEVSLGYVDLEEIGTVRKLSELLCSALKSFNGRK